MIRPQTRLILTGIVSMVSGAILIFLKEKFFGDILAGVGVCCLIFGIVRNIDARSEEP